MTNHSVTDLFIPTPTDVQNLVFWIVMVCLIALCLAGIYILVASVLEDGPSGRRSERESDLQEIDPLTLTEARRDSLDVASRAGTPDEGLRLVYSGRSRS